MSNADCWDSVRPLLLVVGCTAVGVDETGVDAVGVEAVVPERLRQHMADTALLAPAGHFARPITVDPGELRRALRHKLKVHFHYRDGEDRPSARAARPLALAFYGPVWLLVAWCELRQDFRSFRLDRMARLEVLHERFRPEPGKTIHDYLKRDGN